MYRVCLSPLCCGSNRGVADGTVVFEERDWKDFISFLAVGGVTPPSLRTPPLLLRHTPQCYGARQGRCFKISLIVKIETPRKAMGYGKGEGLKSLYEYSFSSLSASTRVKKQSPLIID